MNTDTVREPMYCVTMTGSLRHILDQTTGRTLCGRVNGYRLYDDAPANDWPIHTMCEHRWARQEASRA